jgi:hypothetical protein
MIAMIDDEDAEPFEWSVCVDAAASSVPSRAVLR